MVGIAGAILPFVVYTAGLSGLQNKFTRSMAATATNVWFRLSRHYLYKELSDQCVNPCSMPPVLSQLGDACSGRYLSSRDDMFCMMELLPALRRVLGLEAKYRYPPYSGVCRPRTSAGRAVAASMVATVPPPTIISLFDLKSVEDGNQPEDFPSRVFHSDPHL